MFPADDREVTSAGTESQVEGSSEPQVEAKAILTATTDEEILEGRKPTIRLNDEPKQKEEDQPKPFPLADPGQYYVGLWSGLPLFGCPFCPYTSLASDGGDGQIELHILYRIDAGDIKHRKALETEGGLV